MFRDIESLRIKITDKKKKHSIYLPNVISIDPLDKLYRATEWLFEEAVADLDKTNKTVAIRRSRGGYSKQNIDDIEALGLRLGSRTQSYVNQLCLLEDLLRHEYVRMCNLLKVASVGNISYNHKQDTLNLIERMSSIRLFRNKVVAHTAYTKPLKDRETGVILDNPETIVRSAINLFPKRGDLRLGNNFYNGFSKWQSEIPVISMFTWEAHAQKVLIDWKELYIKRLCEIQDRCPIDNKNYTIEIAYPSKSRKFRSELKNKAVH